MPACVLFVSDSTRPSTVAVGVYRPGHHVLDWTGWGNRCCGAIRCPLFVLNGNGNKIGLVVILLWVTLAPSVAKGGKEKPILIHLPHPNTVHRDAFWGTKMWRHVMSASRLEKRETERERRRVGVELFLNPLVLFLTLAEWHQILNAVESRWLISWSCLMSTK